MIPGPYSLWLVTFPDDASDAPGLHILQRGYDTAAQAHSARKRLCQEEGHQEDDVVVARLIDLDEADKFTD